MGTTLAHNSKTGRAAASERVVTIAVEQKRFGIADVQALFEKVWEYTESGYRDIILDFSSVDEICPTIVGLLTILSERLQGLGGGLRLRHAPRQLEEILRMFHLEDRFNLADSRAPLRNAG